jgi:hypothetical protein
MALTPWTILAPDGTPASKWNFPNLAGTVQAIAASQARLFGLYAINNQTATAAYVQLFDVVAASVNLGTTVPDEQLFLSASGPSTAFLWLPNYGLQFVNGISVASTTTISGSTGSAAGVYVYAMYLMP